MAERKKKRRCRYTSLMKNQDRMKKKVLEELCHTAFDSMDNYVDLTEEEGKTTVRLRRSEMTDLSNVKEISSGKNGVNVKLYSKDRAIDRLARYLGIWKENAKENTAAAWEDLEAIEQMVKKT